MFGTTNRKRLGTGAAVILIVGVVAAASARAQQPAPGEGRGRMGPRPWAMAAEQLGLPIGQLDLSDAQREQFRGIMQANREEMQAKAQAVTAARKALDQAVVAGDEAAIRGKAEELGSAMADAAVLRSRVRAQVLQILTPEQQAKANQMRAGVEQRAQQRRERMRQHMEQRPKGTPPAGGQF